MRENIPQLNGQHSKRSNSAIHFNDAGRHAAGACDAVDGIHGIKTVRHLQATCGSFDWLQEDKSRVEIFKEYARKTKQSVWSPFLGMLNRHDPFIVSQVTSDVITHVVQHVSKF